MILTTPYAADRYRGIHAGIGDVLDHIAATALPTLPLGRHVIDGDRVFAVVEHGEGRNRSEASLEAHRRFIDVQLVLAGDEEMGWRPLSACRHAVGEYDPERDIIFFTDAPASWIAVPPGHCCIFFPEDAHAPLVGRGGIIKIVYKIAI